MVNAGASIEAFLKLDATEFKIGIDKAVGAVENFKKVMIDIGKESVSFNSGFGAVNRALNQLYTTLTRFDNVSSKQVNTFRTLASGMNLMAEAAQRLTTVAQRGAIGIETLNTVIDIWSTGVSNATVTVNGLGTALSKIVSQSNSTRSSMSSISESLRQLSSSEQTTRQQFLLLENTLAQSRTRGDEFRAMTQQLRTEFGLTGEKLVELRSHLINVGMSVDQYKEHLVRMNEQLKLSEAEFRRASAELLKFANTGINLYKNSNEISQLRSALIQLEDTEIQASERSQLLREATTMYRKELMALALGVEQFNAIETGQIANKERLKTATDQATQSIQRQASASRTTTTSLNEQTVATNKLKNAMSSLRMIGTMVASMMVWNFAHNLVTATRETVNAKSEMEGYFQMLHFSQGEIDDFNQALDQTVSRFQRINKYSLGETISSIGVEFELTTEEMKKAMPVVSMITSEYLRAGRNVNEASLAVKDILQGEFQRLSRETGVKGDQLKEAGWSGDKSDVMGLLEALDKVGKSRNWDTFVVKANSLNDAVLILQNRFGEWSAEMVNVVQPTILGVFNTLMTVGGVFGNIMSGIWQWINGDGIANQIVKWTGLATAIGLVVGVLVSYRTGANLVQLVQMGLTGSINATIFGLKAEEVALYGSRNALVAKLTSIKAETVAQMGVKRAIASKVLGLKAEKVANMGVKGSIMESVLARKIEEAEMRNATTIEKIAIASKHQEEVANMSTLKTIFARIAGVEMETYAEKGLIVALAQRIASSPLYIGSLEAEEIATLSTAEASLILAGTLLPIVAIIAGVAMALYGLIAPLQQASEEMKAFNKIVEDGDNLIKSSKKTWDSFIEQEDELNNKLGELTEGSQDYLRVSKQVEQVTKNKKTAEKDYYNTVKAVEMARSSQNKYEERYAQIGIEAQTELADAYIKAGISAEEAYELANDNLANATAGAKQLREALQMIKLEQTRGSEKTSATIDMLDQYGLSDDKIKEYGERFRSANEKIREGMAKFMTSDDLMERIGGWGELQLGRLEEWWTRLNAFFEVRDWESMGKMIHDGFMSVWRMFPWNKMLEDVGKSIQDKGLVATIMNALFGEGDSDGALDIIWQFMNEVVIQPLGEWLGWFMEDPVGHFDEMAEDWSLELAKFLFGKDQKESIRDMTGDWIDNQLIPGIGEAIASYFSVENILSGGFTFGGIGALTSSLPKLLFGEDASIESIVQSITDYFSQSFNSVGTVLPILVDLYIIQPISTAMWNGILSIPLVGDFIQLLGLVTDENVGASEKGRAIGNWIGNALTFAIGQIPIVGDILRMLGLIPNTYSDANGKGYGVGDNIKSGEASGHKGMAENVSTEVGRIIEYLKNSDTLQGVFDAGFGIGGKILGGVKGGLGMNSPGILSRETIPSEFGVNIPNAITDSSSIAYASAQSYAQNMYDGMNSVQNNGFGLGGVVDEYQADAQVITNSSQMMGSTTTSAFNDMSSTVNATTGQMATDVGSQYTSMQQKQGTMLNTMKTQNLSAYNDMYLKSNQSLIQMRDSTSNVTNQMTNAWNHMKNNIIASANQLKSQSTSHFNQLSSTIGDFYGKIQNPSRWGSGPSSSGIMTRTSRNTSFGRNLAHTFTRHGAGGNPTGGKHTGSSMMSVAQAKRLLCPSGDCGNLFDGYSLSDKIDINDLFASVNGEHGFGWNDWDGRHYSHIRSTTNQWSMKSPRINLAGGIDTNTNFKVGEFENGRPNVSFSTFQSIAGSIFSRIPYKMYYDSSWKGSWLGALQAGACNCSDGADALIALASVFGFSGYKQWGKWGNTGHFWAVINGVPMDTTAWQGGYGWTSPKVSGYGSPNIRRATPSVSTSENSNKTVNVTVDMSNSTIYGVEDLDSRIEQGVKRGLREEFNDSYSVVI